MSDQQHNSTDRHVPRGIVGTDVPLGVLSIAPRQFHTTEDVEIDIQRDTDNVAIVIKDLSLPPNHNENSTLHEQANDAADLR
jgi:hypothetical protein